MGNESRADLIPRCHRALHGYERHPLPGRRDCHHHVRAAESVRGDGHQTGLRRHRLLAAAHLRRQSAARLGRAPRVDQCLHGLVLVRGRDVLLQLSSVARGARYRHRPTRDDHLRVHDRDRGLHVALDVPELLPRRLRLRQVHAKLSAARVREGRACGAAQAAHAELSEPNEAILNNRPSQQQSPQQPPPQQPQRAAAAGSANIVKQPQNRQTAPPQFGEFGITPLSVRPLEAPRRWSRGGASRRRPRPQQHPLARIGGSGLAAKLAAFPAAAAACGATAGLRHPPCAPSFNNGRASGVAAAAERGAAAAAATTCVRDAPSADA